MYAVFKVHSMFTQLNSLTFVKVRELPRTKFKLRLRLAFIQLLSANGDGEIRTLDPLLARQVLSQLSYTPKVIWHPPALPCRLQHSTIGRLGLNRRVRDGNGCVPQPHRHQNSLEPLSEIQQI